MNIRIMDIADYDKVYDFWMSCKNKVALLVFNRNEVGNAFWESQGFIVRDDVAYRNRALTEIVRIDT